jgi:hypothetical protein
MSRSLGLARGKIRVWLQSPESRRSAIELRHLGLATAASVQPDARVTIPVPPDIQDDEERLQWKLVCLVRLSPTICESPQNCFLTIRPFIISGVRLPF